MSELAASILEMTKANEYSDLRKAECDCKLNSTSISCLCMDGFTTEECNSENYNRKRKVAPDESLKESMSKRKPPAIFESMINSIVSATAVDVSRTIPIKEETREYTDIKEKLESAAKNAFSSGGRDFNEASENANSWDAAGRPDPPHPILPKIEDACNKESRSTSLIQETSPFGTPLSSVQSEEPLTNVCDVTVVKKEMDADYNGAPAGKKPKRNPSKPNPSKPNPSTLPKSMLELMKEKKASKGRKHSLVCLPNSLFTPYVKQNNYLSYEAQAVLPELDTQRAEHKANPELESTGLLTGTSTGQHFAGDSPNSALQPSVCTQTHASQSIRIHDSVPDENESVDSLDDQVMNHASSPPKTTIDVNCSISSSGSIYHDESDECEQNLLKASENDSFEGAVGHAPFIPQNPSRNHTCHLCLKGCRFASTLTTHLKPHTGEKPYKCTLCEKKFSRKCILNGHMVTHTGDKPYKCTLCEKKFARKNTLNGHMVTHTGDKPYECTFCEKKFARKNTLSRHITTHTREKPYECTLCEKTFAQKGTLNRHITIHTREKLYECTLCEKKFSQRSTFNGHMRTHAGDKPYECTLCEKKFSQKGILNGHMVTHTGDKPYECTFCEKKFARKNTLSRHITTHTREKLYECILCEKKFSQRSTFNGHMRTHAGDKPYECTLCEKKFSQKGILNGHMVTHTGDKPYIGKPA
ncbi:hypothetical protein JCM33374_g2219 [Metschnikowia sp. JCM 33374]|nr:hypothetical protein JCM33374_g2219 [Metschnikowia sp. JCM 33374]